jgi:glycosyltransferase involved in cell wall biosynthesis
VTGAVSVDRNILKELALLGVKCDIILPEGHILEENAVEGWTINEVKMPPRSFMVYHTARLARFPRTIYSLYKEHGFDLLRVHSFFSANLETLWTKIWYRLPVPTVVHFHHLDTQPLRRFIAKTVMRCSEAVITPSYAAKEDIVKYLNIPPQKIHVVYHGIERRFCPRPINLKLLRQLGCSSEEQILLFVGNMEQRKNPLFLLDVLKELLSLRKKVKLVLCGTGPLWGMIRQKVNQLELGNYVVLAGAVPEHLMPDYYNLADVFVFPSILEGFGLVIGEAMSCGKPVVAFNTSAIPEVVEDGVAGFLVSPGNKSEFVQKVLLLIENKKLRIEMGNRAIKRVDQLFRWERAARETLNIYQQITKKGF